MDNALIELIDKKNSLVKHSPLQVSLNFKAEDIAKYLNTIYNKKNKYRFYIKNILVQSDLKYEIEKRNLGTEEKIVIEYETDDIDIPDILIEEDDVISFLNSVEMVDEYQMYYSTYNGPMKKISINKSMKNDEIKTFLNNKKDNEKNFGFYGVKGVCNRGEYLYNAVDQIINISSGKIITEFKDEEISCIASFNGLIVLGTSCGKVITIKENKIKEIVNGHSHITTVFVNEKYIYYSAVDGRLGKYNYNTDELNKKKTNYSIVSGDIKDDLVVWGTTNNVIILCNKDESETTTKVLPRYLMHAIICNETKLVLIGQKSIHIVEGESGDECGRICFSGFVNGACFFSNHVFISLDKKIYGYKISANILN